MQVAPIPPGLCQCGCGSRTKISNSTSAKKGARFGEPHRYAPGHNNRGKQLRQEPDYAVDPGTGCWVWLKSRRHGYGQKRVGGRGGRLVRAHRWYYEQIKGPIPDGLSLDHLCRNRACVNPDHLEPVTQAENVRRGAGTKLQPDDLVAIHTSAKPNIELAQEFGVDASTICHVKAGRRSRLR